MFDLAREFGAHTINASSDDFAQLAQEFIQGKPDVVVDGTGTLA